MIRFLRGRLAERGKGYVVIDVGGVGFQVFTPGSPPIASVGGSTQAEEPGRDEEGGEISLHTRLNVRDDALTLFGFSTTEEASLFDLLLTVSGVGPRVAMGVIAACPPRRFLQLMVFEDVDGLARLPGLGKKLSQRLIVELRDKLAPRRETFGAGDFAVSPAEADPVEEAVEALAALGYGRVEAAQAVGRARQDLGEAASATDLLKHSLKRI